MTVLEKLAYINGLMEGMKFDTDSNEGKIMMHMLEALELLAEDVDALNDVSESLGEEIDAISDDLLNVEDYLFDDEDDCDCDCDCCDDDCEIFVECPTCHARIELDEEDLEEDGIECPGCGEQLEFEFDEDEDGDE